MLNFPFFLKSKSGQGLPIETIIVIVLLLIVLIIILFIFSDQSSTIFDSVRGFLGLAESSTPTNLSEVIK